MICGEFEKGRACSWQLGVDDLEDDFNTTRIGHSVTNSYRHLRHTYRDEVCEMIPNLCGQALDAEFERKGKQYVIDQLVKIDTYYTHAEGCFFMNALAEQYKNELYFHMYMSNIVEPDRFDDIWRKGCEESEECHSESGEDSGVDSVSGSGYSTGYSSGSGEDSGEDSGQDSGAGSEPDSGNNGGDEELCKVEICWHDYLNEQQDGYSETGVWKCVNWVETEINMMIEAGTVGTELPLVPGYSGQTVFDLEDAYEAAGGKLTDITDEFNRKWGGLTGKWGVHFTLKNE